MDIKTFIAKRYGLISGMEKRIDGRSLLVINESAKQLANELPDIFSNLRKGTKVREESTGKIGRIVERSSIEYDGGRKLYSVQFKGEDSPRLIRKSEFTII